jgi:hypothetical protein
MTIGTENLRDDPFGRISGPSNLAEGYEIIEHSFDVEGT